MSVGFLVRDRLLKDFRAAVEEGSEGGWFLLFLRGDRIILQSTDNVVCSLETGGDVRDLS